MGIQPDPDRVIAVLRRHGARFAFVHGSRSADYHRSDSDLDVAAWFGGSRHAPPWVIAAEAGDGVDLMALDGAPLELAGRVALHGSLLFDDDPPARVAWQADTRLVYLDEELLQRELDEVFIEGRARGR